MSTPLIVLFMAFFVSAMFLVCHRRRQHIVQVLERAAFLQCAAYRTLALWRQSHPDTSIATSHEARQLVLDCIAAWIVFLAAHPEYNDDGQRLMYLRSLLVLDDPYHPPPGKRRMSPDAPKRLADAGRFLFALGLPRVRSSGIIIPIYAFRKRHSYAVFGVLRKEGTRDYPFGLTCAAQRSYRPL